ncbi:MAG: hypothetical protein P8H42_10475 [Saprospiraceae bacterium]|nr:hypothetical protein [Saprospiraceae bacterium]
MSKPKVIKNYEKLTEEVKEQIKLVYPMGYTSHLVTFTNREGEKKKGLPFETEDYYYLIRMSEAKAEAIIEDDDDYDDDGNLKKSAKTKYEDKHEDEDFLNVLNSNSDNDLGIDGDDD